MKNKQIIPGYSLYLKENLNEAGQNQKHLSGNVVDPMYPKRWAAKLAGIWDEKGKPEKKADGTILYPGMPVIWDSNSGKKRGIFVGLNRYSSRPEYIIINQKGNPIGSAPDVERIKPDVANFMW